MKFSYFALCAILGAGVISSATARDFEITKLSKDKNEVTASQRGTTIADPDGNDQWYVPMKGKSYLSSDNNIVLKDKAISDSEAELVGGVGIDTEVKNNKITIEGSNLKVVMGGEGGSKVHDNEVVMNGGSTNVVGGRASSPDENILNGGEVYNNTVTINIGAYGWVVGGDSENYNANIHDNVVNINTDKLVRGVYGGKSKLFGETGEAIANNNTVNFIKGMLEYFDFGGDYDDGLYGGSGDTEATGNKVLISGKKSDYGSWLTKIEKDVYGGESKNGKANENSIEIKGGELTEHNRLIGIYGGWGKTEANKNKITILNGKVSAYRGINGGYSENGVANENEIKISGGEIGDYGHDYISGGYGDKANKNKVIISGGEITSNIYGAIGKTEANNNTLTYNNANVTGNIYGAIGAKVKSNAVTTNGGVITGNVYGANGEVATNNGEEATNNKVTVNGGEIIGDVYGASSNTKAQNNIVNYIGGSIKGDLVGGWLENYNPDYDYKGNTLNIGTANKALTMNKLTANNIYGFETINFYLPNTVKNGDVALKLTALSDIKDENSDKVETDLSQTTTNAYLKKTSGLTKDSVIHLIQTAGTLTAPKNNGDKQNEVAAVEIDGLINVVGYVKLASDSKNLDLTFKGDKAPEPTPAPSTPSTPAPSTPATPSTPSTPSTLAVTPTPAPAPQPKGATEDSKQLLETRLAGVAQVVEASELLADNIGGLNSNGNEEVFAYVLNSGNSKEISTGSHIETRGVNINAGIGTDTELVSGKVTTGVFFEYGKGSFDSYLDNGLKGSGDTEYTGGGAFVRYDNNSGLYVEGNGRIGKLTTESDKGKYDEFEIKSTYSGLHFGLGNVFALSSSNDLDIYAKYFYSRTKGDDVLIGSTTVNFDSVSSKRIKLGARDSIALNENNSIYLGGAYVYEADGKAKGTLSAVGSSTEMASPKLKGSSGITELGYKFENTNLEFNLGAKGYFGKERGVSGNMGVVFKF